MEDNLDLVGGNTEGALRGVNLGEEGREGVVVGAVRRGDWKADIKLGNMSMLRYNQRV